MEPNTVLRSVAVVALLLLAGCQPAAPPAPTATSIPTAVSKPAISSPSPSPSGVTSPNPSAAPRPSAVASPSAAAAAVPPVGASRVDVLNAANAAFSGGDVKGASQLYERVVNSPPTGENAQQTAAINGLAHFRAAVALLAAGDEDQAKDHVDALQSADATSAFARLANQLWDQYGMVGSVRGACAQVQPQVASQAGQTLQTLQTMGVSVDPQALCTVPGR